MKWVDEEAYIGVCRRNAARTVLLQRRKRDSARPTPPAIERLFAQLENARPSVRNQMRVRAALDLASRLNDRPMERAFCRLEMTMKERLDEHAHVI